MGGDAVVAGEVSDLIERDGDLALIEDVLEGVDAGVPTLTFIEGSAGLGKTALLNAARARASAMKIMALSARGSDLEEGYSYGVVRQLFEPLLVRASQSDRKRFLQGAAWRAASILLPTEEADLTPAPDLTMATMHGLFWLCANVAATRPMLLLVDDAQWADTSSLHWLHYLKQRWEGMNLAAVVTVRSGEPAGDALMRLAAGSETRRHALAPLSPEGAANLIRTRVDATASDDLCRRCYTATAGNPFYLRELAAELEGAAFPVIAPEDGASVTAPATVARAVTLRLHRLGGDAVALARAIAVLGSATDLIAAAQLAGLRSDAALVAADRLTAVQLLSPGPPLQFAHAIVRSAVYGEMSVAERVRAHGRAAHVLKESGIDAELVAAHLLHSEPARDAWTVTTLREAARLATSRGAPDGAVRYLRRALSEDRTSVPRALLHELGRAEFECHDPAALDHLCAAAAAAGAPDDESAAVASGLALALSTADRSEESVAVLDAALARRQDADDDWSLRLEARLLGTGFLHPSTRELHAKHLARAQKRAIPDTRAGRQVVAALAGCTALQGVPSPETTAAVARLLNDGRLLESVFLTPDFYLAANALLYLGRYREYVEWMTRVLQAARDTGSMRGFWQGSCSRSWGRLQEGYIRAAEADARAALDSGIRRGWALQAMAVLVEVLIESGRLTEAAGVVADYESAQPDTPATMDQFLVFSRGRVRMERGDLCGALADFRAVGDVLARCGFADPTMWPWRSQAALCLAGLGGRGEAIELAEEQAGLAGAVGAPGAHGTALRALGVLVGGADGRRHLENAVTILEASEARLEHTRAMVDLGAALRRQGSRTEASRMLTRARETAHDLGATVLKERARVELLATGARPRRIATTGRDALTASELRVAEMASQGLANAELAQALFVSPKTIDTHLTHIYGKLDIHSRRELRDALAGSDPVSTS